MENNILKNAIAYYTTKISGGNISAAEQMVIDFASENYQDEFSAAVKNLTSGKYKFIGALEKDKAGNIKKSTANIVNIFKNDPYFSTLSYEVHTHQAYLEGQKFTAINYAPVNNHLFETYGFVLEDKVMERHVNMEADYNHFNLIKEKMLSEELRITFDPIKRYFIDGLGMENNKYNYNIILKQFKAAYARGINENLNGVPKDEVVIFEGPQGIGKSKLLEFLGGEFYTGDIKLSSVFGDKDNYQILANKLIVEFGELTGLNYADNERVKAFISKTYDEYRPSHKPNVIIQPRTCVFFATTNEDYYLRGDNGNRRFIPVRCEGGNIDTIFELKDRAKVKQFWAFIREEYIKDPNLLFDKEETEYLREIQSKKNVGNCQERLDDIMNYCTQEFPTNWDKLSVAQQEDWLKYGSNDKNNASTEVENRDCFCVKEISYHVFGVKDKAKRTDYVRERMKAAGLVSEGTKYRSRTWGVQAKYQLEKTLFAS